MHDAMATLIVAITPGIAALLLACAAYVQAQATRIRQQATHRQVAVNTARLDSLENGGGDRKIDERLAKHGLFDRRARQEPPVLVGTQAEGLADADKTSER